MPTSSHRPHRRIRRRARRRAERRRISALLRTETVGGMLLVAAAVLAVVAANSPLHEAYLAVRDYRIGPSALGLSLSVQQWTADGLLTLFFFLAGLELKREFVVGELRDPRRAVVPVAAAVGGMVVPAVIYLLVVAGTPGAATGWAIPTATDIAFALAVLAVVGRHLPSTLRTFLLTLAVVDDLLAIVVIALFYTRRLDWGYLGLALVAVAVFTAGVQRGRGAWWGSAWLLLPVAVTAWALMHASGVHATVAGVLMGFAVPVLGRRRSTDDDGDTDDTDDASDVGDLGDPGDTDDADDGSSGRARAAASARAAAPCLVDRLDHLLRPLSAGVAVPLFAFFAAGVSVGGITGLARALSSPVALGVAAGLVVGKPVGILLATLLTTRLTRSPMLSDLASADLVGLAMLGGVGFTVSLLIGDLAFSGQLDRAAEVQVAVLAGSVLASVLAGIVLAARSRRYRAASLAPDRR